MQNQRLRRERELHGWSQARVAREIGTDPATVSRWERGLSFPYPYFREKLCALFEKNAQELGLVQDGIEEQHEQHALPASSPSTFIYDPAIPLISTVEYFVGREPLLQQLKQHVCGDKGRTIGLYGLPGVGKTALAVQLVNDEEILRHFRDGILWAALGTDSDVPGHLRRWGELLNINPTQVFNKDSYEAWAEAIHYAVGTRQMLLIIDDVWELEDALALKIGGPRCAHVITTRSPHIALNFAGNGVTALHELDERDGVTLLHYFVPQLPIKKDESAQALVRAVGGLPLALTLIGKYLRTQAYSHQPRRLHTAIKRLEDTRERMELSVPYAVMEQHSSLLMGAPLSLQSVIAASERLLDTRARAALRALAAFPCKPDAFSEDAAIAVCAQPREVLDTLTDAGLLESDDTGRYMLHKTISDYARLHLQGLEPYWRLMNYGIDYLEQHREDSEALDMERSTLLAALQIAAEQHRWAEFWQRARIFVPFLLAHGRYAQAEHLLQHACSRATEGGDVSEVGLLTQYLEEIARNSPS